MNLLDKINSALKESALKQEKDKVLTLRMVIAAIKDKEIEKRSTNEKNIKDADVIAVLNKMLKQRRESLEIYNKASRVDLSEKEQSEINFIQYFLPKQLNESETRKVCEESVKDSGASSIKDMGKVMSILKIKYATNLDFTKAGAILKEILSK
jgi:uncharacterized protein YqeY